ncbi:MAG: hypothetical protein PHY64_08045, partial [Eubacteriales bacterium]|nr:hypothetical protein [Eubacteriales bacterium]
RVKTITAVVHFICSPSSALYNIITNFSYNNQWKQQESNGSINVTDENGYTSSGKSSRMEVGF